MNKVTVTSGEILTMPHAEIIELAKWAMSHGEFTALEEIDDAILQMFADRLRMVDLKEFVDLLLGIGESEEVRRNCPATWDGGKVTPRTLAPIEKMAFRWNTLALVLWKISPPKSKETL